MEWMRSRCSYIGKNKLIKVYKSGKMISSAGKKCEVWNVEYIWKMYFTLQEKVKE